MYKNSNYRNYKGHLFLIASVKSPLLLWMGKLNAKTKSNRQYLNKIYVIYQICKNIWKRRGKLLAKFLKIAKFSGAEISRSMKKEQLREFVQRSKHFLLRDHFIKSHNVFSWWCNNIVRGKLKLVNLVTWRVKWPAASLGEGTSGRLKKVLFTVIYWQLCSQGI